MSDKGIPHAIMHGLCCVNWWTVCAARAWGNAWKIIRTIILHWNPSFYIICLHK